MNRFVGKVALVTGAASGIGLATAQRLAREGAEVLTCDVNAALLNEEVPRLVEEGLKVSARVVDVTDVAACRAAVAGFMPPEGADSKLLSRLVPLTPQHGRPADIAATVDFIASDESRFMTGAGVVVDGAQTAILPRLYEVVAPECAVCPCELPAK